MFLMDWGGEACEVQIGNRNEVLQIRKKVVEDWSQSHILMIFAESILLL